MTIKSIARLLSIGAFVLALGSPTWADEDKDKKDSETSGSVTVAGQAGSGIDDSSKLQEYETVPKGTFLESAFFKWKNKDNYFLDFKGTKLGLEDQFAALTTGKKGSYNFFAVWDQNPNWKSNTARTPYSETSPGVFHVPDGMRKSLQDVYVPWVPPTSSNPIGTGSAPANPTVPGYYAVEPWVNDSQPIDIKYVRKTGKTGLNLKSGENWAFNVGFANENRNGNKNTTFYGGPNYEIASPIDYVTNTLRADAEYAKGRTFLNSSFEYSTFNNKIPTALIDNPERLELANPANGRNVINDVTTFRLALPPDNNAWTWDATGGFTFGKRQKVTASLATGQMKMNTDLVPLSTNPYLATSATAPEPRFTITPPYNNVEARYDTLMAAFKFTGDPSSKFGYIFTYRKFELKDKTDEYTFQSSVRGDVGPSYSAAGFSREHEGWAVQTLKGEVHVLPFKGLRLGASYGEDKREYDAREYSDVTDKNFALTADYNYDRVSFHGSWTTLDRKPGGAGAGIPPTWAGATQTDITERNRHILSGLVTLMPSDKFAISFTGQKQSNDFAESVTGLLDQTFDSFGADFTYSPNAKFNAWAGYVYEKYFFSMAAAYIARGASPPFDPANLWTNDTTDKVDTFRVGFTATPQADKWDINASVDYTKPRSDSTYDFARPGTPIGGLNEANGIFPANVPPIPGFPPYTFTSFPQVSKNFLIAKISLNYHIQKNMILSVLYWKQKFDNVDWQTNNPGVNGEPFTPYMGRVDPGANRWFFLGAQVPSYDANIFRAALTYRF